MALTRTKEALQLFEKIAFDYEERFQLIDSYKRQIIQALLYTNTYLFYYQENLTACPHDLFNLLIDVTQQQTPGNLSSDPDDREVEEYLLSELGRSLVMVSDLMMSRGTIDHLNSFIEIARKFPESILRKLACPELNESATLDFLEREGLIITEDKLYRTADKQYAIDCLARNIYSIDLNKIPKELHQSTKEALFDYIEKAKHSWQLNENSTKENVTSVIRDILRLNPADVEERTLLIIQYVKKLTEDYPDKEILTTCFFSVCKENLLDSYPYTIPLFFPYFESLLPPNRFEELLSSHKLLDVLIAKIFEKTIFEFEYTVDQARASLGALIFYITPKELMEKIEKLAVKGNHAPLETFLSHALVHNQFIFPFLRVMGRNFSEQLVLQHLDTPLDRLPPIFQTDLIKIFKDNPALEKVFIKFVNNLIKVNDKADNFHKRNITLFFATYQAKIVQIIQLLGIQGIKYLNSQVAETLLSIERLLNQVPIFDNYTFEKVDHYSKTYSDFFAENIQNCNILLTIMGILKLLIDNVENHEEVGEYFPLAENIKPSEYQQFLLGKVLSSLLPGIKITAEQQQVIFNKISQNKLFKLLNATRHMRDNDYREVYLALLKRNLLDEDVHEFLHNTEQEEELGIRLARHNQKIRRQLRDAGIVPEIALHYPEKLSLVYCNTSGQTADINPKDLYAQLHGHITQLLERIKDVNDLDGEAQKKIDWLHFEIPKILSFIKDNPEDYFTNKMFQEFYNGLVKRINKLKNNKTISNSVKEFIDHIKDDIDNIQNKSNAQTALENNYTFHIEQWDKSKFDTFFLGDEVGCCLATTNAQFHAMVQRRLDDAMLFHVAVDQATNKPAALAWLYLAKRADNKIILMANFFEVNRNYAQSLHLRRTLLDGLLKFTHQYCQANPKIAAFYMNQLSYGRNQGDLTNYPIQQIELLDKIGGSFIPSATESDEGDVEDAKECTTLNYYLASLEENQFHQYNPKISVVEIPSLSEPLMNKPDLVSAPQVFYCRQEYAPVLIKIISKNTEWDSHDFEKLQNMLSLWLSRDPSMPSNFLEMLCTLDHDFLQDSVYLACLDKVKNTTPTHNRNIIRFADLTIHQAKMRAKKQEYDFAKILEESSKACYKLLSDNTLPQKTSTGATIASAIGTPSTLEVSTSLCAEKSSGVCNKPQGIIDRAEAAIIGSEVNSSNAATKKTKQEILAISKLESMGILINNRTTAIRKLKTMIEDSTVTPEYFQLFVTNFKQLDSVASQLLKIKDEYQNKHNQSRLDDNVDELTRSIEVAYTNITKEPSSTCSTDLLNKASDIKEKIHKAHSSTFFYFRTKSTLEIVFEENIKAASNHLNSPKVSHCGVKHNT